MKIIINTSHFFKGINCFFILIMVALFTACGSDKDEPKTEDPEPGVSISTIDPSILPGNWIVEKCESLSGKTSTINLPFSILPFQVKQTSDYIPKDDFGSEYWGESYDAFTSYITSEGVKTHYGLIGFCKPIGASLSAAKIYEMTICVDYPDNEEFFLGVLADMRFEGNELKGFGSYSVKGEIGSQEAGYIYLRKLK